MSCDNVHSKSHTNDSNVSLDAFHSATCRCTGKIENCQHAKSDLAIITSILETVKAAASKQCYLKQSSGMYKSHNSLMMTNPSYYTASIFSIDSVKNHGSFRVIIVGQRKMSQLACLPCWGSAPCDPALQ